MMDQTNRLNIISSHPIFAILTQAELQELNDLFTVKNFNANEIAVTEGHLVDAIYFIVRGTAEVKRKNIPIATLHDGESIGLSETGLFATTGERTATVIAQTNLTLLCLNVDDLNNFLKKHPTINQTMQKNVELIVRMNFIKQSVPFAYLSVDQLYYLAQQVTEQTVATGVILFYQSKPGTSCYLIRSGKVAITAKENGTERLLAELTAPAIFGETALIMNAPRNATAKTLEPTTLLMITQEVLAKVLNKKMDTAEALMNIIYTRSRPLHSSFIEDYHRKTADKQEIVTLKNIKEGKYFQLSNEGWFIWEQLNGKNTLQEITLKFFNKFKIFDPALVSNFIMDLNRAGFVEISKGEQKIKTGQLPFWLKLFISIRHIFEYRITFGNVDAWLTKTYQRGIYIFFTKPMQIILGLLAIMGLLIFVLLFPQSIKLLSTTPHAGWLLLLVIPIGKGLCLLHELGHAYATKAFGRNVKSFGIGWFWFGPIAFCDTSDMWLNPARQRLIVDLAGLYVDIIIAAIAATLAFFVKNPYLFLFLWLLALFNYLTVFINLSPILELDGYYALMDLFDKPNLRATSVTWLLKKFPATLRQPKLILQNPVEATYWLLCIIYLCLEIIVPYFLMNFLLHGLLGKRNPLISLIIALIVTIFSVLGLWAEVRYKRSSS